MVLLIMPAVEAGFFAGAPGFGFDGFYGSGLGGLPSRYDSRYHNKYGDFYPGSYHGRHSQYDGEYGHDDYYDHFQPCPRYRPMQVSNWQMSSRDQLLLEVSVPDVHHQNVDAWLSRDASSIHVKGLRALPPQGPRCLPSSTKLSKTGHYEILEMSISVPNNADIGRATVQKLRGGLKISMPRQVQLGQPEIQKVSMPADGNSIHSQKPKLDATQSRSVMQNSRKARITGMSRGDMTTDPHIEATRSRAVHNPAPTVMHPKVVLPPSTGIEVEDAEFPWPEERPDAAAGWIDNRGEFQFY
jgi:hypothetical protein